MSTIQILTDAAQAKRESARKHAAASEDLLSKAGEAQSLADLESAEADQIEADIAFIQGKDTVPEPRVFAGRGKA